jgi:hypothetical protein
MKLRVCMLLGNAILAVGQFSVVTRENLPARLWIEIGSDGEQRVSLTTSLKMDPDAIVAAFTRSLGCIPSNVDASPNYVRLSTNCASSHPTPLSLHTGLRVAELAQPLRSAGIATLDVTLTPPNLGRIQVTPAIPIRGASQRQIQFRVDDLPAEVAVDASYDATHLWTLGAGALGLLCLPLLLLLRPGNLAQLWALEQALFLAGWAGWIWVLDRSQAWTLAAHVSGHWLAGPLAASVPPLLALWAGAHLAARRFVELTPNQCKLRPTAG